MEGADGCIASTEEEIGKMFVNNFVHLFTTHGHVYWEWEENVVSPYINSLLCSLVERGEVKAVIVQLGALKALGPDSFPGIFYQAYWDILGPSLTVVVHNFFFHR